MWSLLSEEIVYIPKTTIVSLPLIKKINIWNPKYNTYQLTFSLDYSLLFFPLSNMIKIVFVFTVNFLNHHLYYHTVELTHNKGE